MINGQKMTSNISLTQFTNCPTCQQNKVTTGSELSFLKSVSVWINKPHVANRRLCGAKIVTVLRSDCKKTVEERLKDFNNRYDQSCDAYPITEPFKDLSEETSSYTLLIRELIPKSDHFKNIHEAVLYDKSEVSVTFIPLKYDSTSSSPDIKETYEVPYTVSFGVIKKNLQEMAQSNEITIKWSCECDDGSGKTIQRQASSQWLRSVLLNKFVNWSQVDGDLSTEVTSLQLVAVDRYKEEYVRLKNTYGRSLVENWTENTDPKKFVYEDVAIAAYLLLVWEEDRQKKNLKRKQTFVDLGCGNGLLVYILTKEGHPGLGLDLRKRKIWDTFGPGIDLQEKSVIPSGDSLFPDFDWIIGNHSDELTPWIPVITARSSFDCCFFVLPCCHHDFIGKFSAVEKGKSQYMSYLGYVREIIQQSGFHPETDTLRIPSTKRICYIGRQRSYEKKKEKDVDRELQKYIDRRVERVASLGKAVNKNLTTNPDVETHVTQNYSSLEFGHKRKINSENCDTEKKTLRKEYQDTENSNKSGNVDNNDRKWSTQFKPRVEDQVRNCQHVAESTKSAIVSKVFDEVLNEDKLRHALLDDGRKWRKGGAVALSSVAQMFDKATLQELKAECGGLQTLLRNHSHVFQVTGGKVQLRDFSMTDPWQGRNVKKAQKGERKVKTTLCWFNSHHPDGCPREKMACLFAHGSQELRT